MLFQSILSAKMLTKIEKCAKVLMNIAQNDSVDDGRYIKCNSGPFEPKITCVLTTSHHELHSYTLFDGGDLHKRGYNKNIFFPRFFILGGPRQSLLETHLFTWVLYFDGNPLKTELWYPLTPNVQHIVHILLHFRMSYLGRDISTTKNTHSPTF